MTGAVTAWVSALGVIGALGDDLPHALATEAGGSRDLRGGDSLPDGGFNLSSASHGAHAGDMPVLLVSGDGVAWAEFQTDAFAIDDLLDADGSAVIVHAAPDNYANIPARYSAPGPDPATLATGDAGARIACGVVGRP